MPKRFAVPIFFQYFCTYHHITNLDTQKVLKITIKRLKLKPMPTIKNRIQVSDASQGHHIHESQSAKVYPSRTIVHAKLEMTEPGDHNEQEADAVANTIAAGGKISRKISGGGGASGITVSNQMESQLNHLQGGGQAMPIGLRNMMESGFRQNFSHVRLHTDSEAATLSSSIHAKAFTHGNDIYFNRGQFNPKTVEGQRLVAHELTHVVQGRGKVGRWFTFNQSQENSIASTDTMYSVSDKRRQITDEKIQKLLLNDQWRAVNMLKKCIKITTSDNALGEYKSIYNKYFPINQLSIVHENYNKILNVIRTKKVNISQSESPKWWAYVMAYDMREKMDENGNPKETDGYSIVIDKDFYNVEKTDGPMRSRILIHELAHEELLANSKAELTQYDTEYYSGSYDQPACVVKSNDNECVSDGNVVNIIENPEKAMSCVSENVEGCSITEIKTNIEDVKKLMCCGEFEYAMNNAENYARFAYDICKFDFDIF